LYNARASPVLPEGSWLASEKRITMFFAAAVKLYQMSSSALAPAQDGELADAEAFWVEATMLKLQLAFQLCGVMEIALAQSSLAGWAKMEADVNEKISTNRILCK
jgi:hypothetical protein